MHCEIKTYSDRGKCIFKEEVDGVVTFTKGQGAEVAGFIDEDPVAEYVVVRLTDSHVRTGDKPVDLDDVINGVVGARSNGMN